jgi:hypothetical protein
LCACGKYKGYRSTKHACGQCFEDKEKAAKVRILPKALPRCALYVASET